jgi:hypothetical protein
MAGRAGARRTVRLNVWLCELLRTLGKNSTMHRLATRSKQRREREQLGAPLAGESFSHRRRGVAGPEHPGK